ncbi:MAG: HD domain-containing protein [Candidatus Nanohaloarchaea archaeon]|nr:HD domain-containing protein [Candidatus Nanohaloarchaea archaeon]
MLEEVREEARTFFDGVNPAHDWWHVQRVDALAGRLVEETGADERTVRLAVLLHDIGRKKEDEGEIDDHAVWGAEKAEEILADIGVRPGLVTDVKHCVKTHRYSNEYEPETLEAKVLSDADNLDALGAVGIARVFAYSGGIGQEMHGSVPLEEDERGTTIAHLRGKILDLRSRLYTDAADRIAERREEYVRSFLERFEREVEGRL